MHLRECLTVVPEVVEGNAVLTNLVVTCWKAYSSESILAQAFPSPFPTPLEWRCQECQNRYHGYL
jgi:hypothetical protein